MKLKDLEQFGHIVIQCHDNPDADALASGFGLYRYFRACGKEVRFIYSGRFAVQKSNLVLMQEELQIPVEYVQELDKPELLIMVDCQYGAGNVTKFEADTVAVIDHHQVDKRATGTAEELTDIRSHYGSCATVIWQLLKESGDRKSVV